MADLAPTNGLAGASGQSCGNCAFARMIMHAGVIDAEHVSCCVDPPHMFMLLQGPAGRQQPVFATDFPTMKRPQWCGKWRTKLLSS